MTDDLTFPLGHIPVHLGLGARVVRQPSFTGDAVWYEQYGQRNAVDGAEGRLVTMHQFSEPWEAWERHPHGEELVVCTEGMITLHQEIDGQVRSATIGSGEAIINPPGVWHTADVSGTATALFITAGMGTEHRER
jgi:quercetin dioxygenase-like cupin family protein